MARCRALANKNAEAIDGQCRQRLPFCVKFVMVERIGFRPSRPGVINVMHSVDADNMIFVYSLKSASARASQSQASLNAWSETRHRRWNLLYSDSPVVLDDVRAVLKSSAFMH